MATVEEMERNRQEMLAHGHVLSPAERASKVQLQAQKKIGGLLCSGVGAEMLEQLEEMYYHGDLHGPTVEQTYFNLGGRGVVQYLRSLRDAARKDQ